MSLPPNDNTTYVLTIKNGHQEYRPVEEMIFKPSVPVGTPGSGRKIGVVIAGQSNGQSANLGSNGANATNPRIKMMNRGLSTQHYTQWQDEKGSFVMAQDPLQHNLIYKDTNNPDNVSVGFGLSFANEMLKDLEPNDEIYLICCCTGGTGFTESRLSPEFPSTSWRKGQGDMKLYDAMISDVKQCLHQVPELELVALLWHQGETDAAGKNWNYANDLVHMVDHFRTDVGAILSEMKTIPHLQSRMPSNYQDTVNLPFICGTMVASWIASADQMGALGSYVDMIHRTISQRVWLSECVDNSDLQPIYDGIHFDAFSQVVMGQRYYAKWKQVNAHREELLRQYYASQGVTRSLTLSPAGDKESVEEFNQRDVGNVASSDNIDLDLQRRLTIDERLQHCRQVMDEVKALLE
jgi:hypothetical protein